MEATPTKTLAEAYDGMLSRDWDKLLDIVEGGGARLVAYTSVGPDTHAAVFHCVIQDGKRWYWGFNQAKHQYQDRVSIIEWLQTNGLFFIPTKEERL